MAGSVALLGLGGLAAGVFGAECLWWGRNVWELSRRPFDLYLAGPYSGDAPMGHWRRTWRANTCSAWAGALWLNEGVRVWSPLSGALELEAGLAAEIALERQRFRDEVVPPLWTFANFSAYEKLDLAALSGCRRLGVVQLAGWESSVGVTAERAAAARQGLRVGYLDPARGCGKRVRWSWERRPRMAAVRNTLETPFEICLVGPYWTPEVPERSVRVRDQARLVASLKLSGKELVTAPVLQQDAMLRVLQDNRHDWAHWAGWYAGHVAAAREVWVLTRPGWEQDAVVQGVLAQAAALHKRVRYVCGRAQGGYEMVA